MMIGSPRAASRRHPSAMRRAPTCVERHRGPFVRAAAALVFLVSVLAPIGTPVASPVDAQTSDDLTLSLEAGARKARVGDAVIFTVRLENTGSATIPDLFVHLGLPDALDARAVDCPGDTGGSTTFCDLGDVAPGSVAEVLFVVEVGSRERVLNGPVSASASSGGLVLVSDTIPPIKIVGPRRR